MMKYTILVTDDSVFNRVLIINILKKYNKDIEFLEAEDGNEALEILENKDIDLVILDLIMPQKDGYQVLKQMKASAKLKDIPVIINSSDDDVESIKKTLLNGATDYFLKPLKQNEIDVILPIKIQNALKYYEQQKIIKNINAVNKKELQMAAKLQTSLMVKHKNLKIVEMFGKYLPCFDVGGDLYDCIEYGDSTWFFIADVAGHGVAAAMVSSLLKGLFTDAVTKYENTNEVLEHINKVFYNSLNNESIFATGAVGKISNGVLYYSNAGHPYPLLVNTAKRECQFIIQNGILLGAFEDSVFETQQFKVTDENVLITYTDGIYRDRYGSDEEIWKKLSDFTMKNIVSLAQPEAFFEKVISNFTGISKDILHDDITMMILKFNE